MIRGFERNSETDRDEVSLEIQFIGAAQEVTGSQHLLTINGKKILLDCGMFQGHRKEAFEKNRQFIYNPSEIDVMLLSHAHIDHCGNIPVLIKKGFTGHIYSTSATVDLCQIMLRDSAYLQEKDVSYVNKDRLKKGKNPFETLYTVEDVEEAMRHFIGVQYNKPISVAPGVWATLKDAGHILGSAGIFLEIEENGKKINFGFSGDIGRPDTPLLHDPDVLRNLDVLIMESTYGNRFHPVSNEAEEELSKIIRDTISAGGKVIIPAFAVGRTQLLVYILHKLWQQNRIPVFSIYVDSPLALKATEIFRLHPECFDRETYRLFLDDHEDPFGFEKLIYTRSAEESKALNDLTVPYVVISASGMAEGGRILYHLKNNIGNKNDLILFVGYAAQNTLARKIMDGDQWVSIFGDQYEVKSKVKKMDYFSGHADQKELLDYLNFNSPDKLKNIFLVHGEEEQAVPLMEKIKNKGYKSVKYPAPGEVFIV
jgi:metallo-beta-lactamase family protein